MERKMIIIRKVFAIFIVTLMFPVFLSYAEEKPRIKFDDRKWEVGHQESNGQISIVEYVLAGETVNNWSELVTVQKFFGLQDRVTPETFLRDTKEMMTSSSPQAIWNELKVTDRDVLYEWKVADSPATEDQHEIARIISGKEAIYVIHYVTKKIPLSPDKRQQWIYLLSLITLVTDTQESAAGEKTISSELPQNQANFLTSDGMMLIKEGNWAEGLAKLKQAIQINPKEPAHHMNYASMLFNKGQGIMQGSLAGDKTQVVPIFKEVEAELNVAIKLFQKQKDMEIMIGHCSYLLGDVYFYVFEDKEKARSYYQKALDYDPDNPLTARALKNFN